MFCASLSSSFCLWAREQPGRVGRELGIEREREVGMAVTEPVCMVVAEKKRGGS